MQYRVIIFMYPTQGPPVGSKSFRILNQDFGFHVPNTGTSSWIKKLSNFESGFWYFERHWIASGILALPGVLATFCKFPTRTCILSWIFVWEYNL